MSGAVLNSRLLTRLLTSGKEGIERVSTLKEDILSTACELTMLILSISFTFNVTFLTVTSANFCRGMLCISAACAVMRCLSVCVSVTFVDCQNE